ncbi:MAG: DegT/DnrJ/EryC1/StrS family aminotransferase [Actinobacteria bacterium]|nr:DegT/DnrJ/EryC1/StrS family aminotransferase [Actinomycetota bacterium]
MEQGWLGVGPRVAEFEEGIARVFGKRHGAMVNSGSSANILAAEEIPPDATIATPALTFTTTLAYIKDRALLCDVEEGTYQIDFSKIEREPDALFVPNLLGNIPDWSNAPKVFTIEDSCDTVTNAGVGTSQIATTSFYASHVLTAAGGGGMLLTDDDDIAARARSKRAWGRPVVEETDLDGRFRVLSDEDPIVYDSRFIYDHVGYNFQPVEIQAAFGLVQLKKLDAVLETRQKIFQRLHDFFSQYEDHFVLPVTREGANWLAFPLTIRGGIDRNHFARHLEENGVQTRPIFSGNIARQPAYRALFADGQQFPIADQVMKNGILIGSHQGLTDEHLSYLEDVCAKYLAQV